MRYLKTFEVYTVFKDENPQSTNDKKGANKLDADIREFNTKKQTLYNIYMTYTDQNDLLNKLHTQHFIDNIKDKNFTNQVVDVYADLYDKQRQYNDLTAKIKGQQDTLNQQKKVASENPETSEDQISATQDSIADSQKQLSTLSTEITNYKKIADEKLKRMKQELQYTRDRVDYENNKKSTTTTTNT